MNQINLTLLSECRISVVGDAMLDKYWHGQTGRVSPEAPVPVVHVKQCESRPGGAGNVALNLSSLNCQTHLFSVRGEDDNGNELEQQLTKAGIHCHLKKHAQIPTCTKLRVISRNQQLIRCDFEEIIEADCHPNDFESFADVLNHTDVLILSDYGKGMIAQASEWIAHAKAKNIPVLVDPKGHDFKRYHGASLLTPNQKEFELVMGACRHEQDIIDKAKEAIRDCDLQALLITRGKDGMLLVTRENEIVKFPALAREVFDVTGAGDTVIATFAAFLGMGESLTTATEWANYAAGIVVGKLGAACITPEELSLKSEIHRQVNTGVMSQAEAALAISSAKREGEKVVFTNGCFDILHAGHVHYLQQAKRFGDRLIVAVNNDDSVRRLKGSSRPINPLAQRMQCLAALACVDWVVSFSEDTPLNVIKLFSPDVLVKGGDYLTESIVGADFVQMQGGQVKVLDFVDGLSTTTLIEKMRAHPEEVS